MCIFRELTWENLTRLDEEGYLYYMDYTQDYYSSKVIDKMKMNRESRLKRSNINYEVHNYKKYEEGTVREYGTGKSYSY